jgi:UDP-3-O-[3-hydroxymyristoyl] glucosamine N-acyltransferase
MAVHVKDFLTQFPELLTLMRGAPEDTVSALKDAQNAGKSDLIFVFSPKHLKEAISTRSKMWVVHKDLAQAVPAQVTTILTSPNVQLSMARIAKAFFPLESHRLPIRGAKIHASAQISKSARLGENCIIGPGAVIGDGCELGDSVVIGPNTVLEPLVKIGPRTHIYPLVFIGRECEIGADCEIHPNTTIGSDGFGYAYDATYKPERLTHYGRVILEDRVHIGAGVQIDRGTYLDSRIGADTKIDNHSHFGHNIEIGRNVIIPGGMVAAGSAKIGNYVMFGGRTTVGGHLEIPDRTKVSAVSVVGKTIDKPGDYGGFPLQEISEALKTRATLRHLPEMYRQLRQIMKHLGLKDKP